MNPWLWYVWWIALGGPRLQPYFPAMNPAAGDSAPEGPSPEELHAMKTQIWSLNAEMEDHKATFAMAEGEIHRLRGELEAAKAAHSEATASLGVMKAEADTHRIAAREQAAILDKLRKDAAATDARAASEIARLVGELKSSASSVAMKDAEIARLKQALTATRANNAAELENVRLELETAKASATKLERQLTSAKSDAAWDLAKLRGELEAAQKAASARAAEAAQFKKDSEAKVSEIVKLGNELAVAHRQTAENTGEITRLKQELSWTKSSEAAAALRLERHVALVIDGALRQAEVERHHDVSDAMAPLVVRTIKAEIRNSQEDLVQALYPMTGRMVKAYVASAMRDLIEDINRRLESNWLMLRLKSLQTGRSVAELALAKTQRLHVDELYLIRRGSGELIGRWPDTPGTANRAQLLSGILTAINNFASEAFRGEGSALRQIDLEDSQVYLRASPAYLLAVRCTGTAHAAVERVIDDELLSAIEHHREALSTPNPATVATHTALLSELSEHLATRIAEKQADLVRPALGISPVKVLAALILLPVAAWAAWTSIESFKTSRVRSVAQRVIETSTEVKGYPLAIDVEPWGNALTITGLTPTDAAREEVVKRLTDLLPNTQVRDQLSVVPSVVDARPQLALVRGELARLQADTVRASLRRTIDRTRLRLEQAVTDLAALRTSAADPAAARIVQRAEGRATQTIAGLRALQPRLGALQGRHADLSPVKDQLAELSRSLALANGDIAGIIGEERS